MRLFGRFEGMRKGKRGGAAEVDEITETAAFQVFKSSPSIRDAMRGVRVTCTTDLRLRLRHFRDNNASCGAQSTALNDATLDPELALVYFWTGQRFAPRSQRNLYCVIRVAPAVTLGDTGRSISPLFSRLALCLPD